MNVLLTVFACNPNQGSEPGIGWGWVLALSQSCQLTVLTTTCNRPEIEQALQAYPELGIEFIYLDVWPGGARLNRRGRGKLGVVFRLFLWQFRVNRFLAKLVENQKFEILHHLTLGAFRMPFSVAGHGVPSVVGPVGGCEEFPEPLLPESALKARCKERVRNWLNRLHTRYGIGMSRYRKVDLVVSCTKEMAEAFARCQVSSPVMPNIGLPDRQPCPVSKRSEGEALRLLFVGNLVYWKGLELALLALQQMPEQVTLTLVGDGGDRLDVEAEIHRLGLSDRVDLRGAVRRADLLRMYDQFDVFLFPSLHDSGGMAVIEAMCAGLPVVCLDAGGPGISVNNDCGTVVSLGSKDEVVLGLSNAIQNYLDDPVLRERHGRAAVQRVNEAYLWPKNAEKMVQWYEELQS